MPKRALVAVVMVFGLSAIGCAKKSSSSPTPTVTGVVVTGTGAFTNKNDTSQLTATANLSGGTTENVTASATWTSSSQAVASVSSAGVVTAVGHGSSTISAAYQSSTGSLTVLVTLKATPAITGEFQRLCGPFRGRLEVTFAETGRSIGYNITSLTLTMRDFFGTIRASKTFSAADLVSSALGTNHIDANSSRILVYEAQYSPVTDTEDSTASISATVTDDVGNTQTVVVPVIVQRDRC